MLPPVGNSYQSLPHLASKGQDEHRKPEQHRERDDSDSSGTRFTQAPPTDDESEDSRGPLVVQTESKDSSLIQPLLNRKPGPSATRPAHEEQSNQQDHRQQDPVSNSSPTSAPNSPGALLNILA